MYAAVSTNAPATDILQKLPPVLNGRAPPSAGGAAGAGLVPERIGGGMTPFQSRQFGMGMRSIASQQAGLFNAAYGGGGGGGLDGLQQQQVTQIMTDIDYKVFSLKEIFRKGDIIADRKRGAELIGALVRGYLCRQRMQKFRRGVREWRWVRCRPVTYIVDILLANHSKRDVGFHLLKTNRTMKMLNTVFGKWAGVCRQNAPVRRGVKKAAEEKIQNKRISLLRRTFDGLKSASVGDLSTRYANAMRRKLIDTIRLELSEKYKSRAHDRHAGVVPEFEVQKILHRRVLEQFMERQKMLMMKYHYKALVDNVSLILFEWWM